MALGEHKLRLLLTMLHLHNCVWKDLLVATASATHYALKASDTWDKA